MSQGLFRWVQAQGHSPDTPGIPKNVSVPLGIPIKKSTPPRGLEPGGRLPEAQGCYSWCAQHDFSICTALIAVFPESMSNGLNQLPPEPGHTQPDPCTVKHGQPRYDPINGVATSVLPRSTTVLQWLMYSYMYDAWTYLHSTFRCIQLCISMSWRCYPVKVFLSNILPSPHILPI